MKRLILFISFTTAFLYTHAQDTLKLTQDYCRQLALEASENLKKAEVTISKAEGELKSAKSLYLPDVSASVNGGYKEYDISQEIYAPTYVPNMDPTATTPLSPNLMLDGSGQPIIGADGNPVFNSYAYIPIDIEVQGGFIANVTVQQAIYAGGKINAGNQMATIGKQMAEQNLILKHDEVVLEADQAYFLYLSTLEKVKLAHDYHNLLSELVKTVKDAYDAGMTNRNELLKAQVQLNQATLQVQKAKSGASLVRMSLCRVVGMPYDTPVAVSDSIGEPFLDILQLNDVRASVRLEYQLLEKQIAFEEEKIDLVRGDYMPTVGVSAGYGYMNIILDGQDNYTSNGANVLGSIKIPITTFGQRKGKMASAKAERDIKRLEFQQGKEMLQLDIEQARLNLEDAQVRTRLAHEALSQASENSRVSKDNYDVGMETLVNLLEAQAGWQSAYADLIDAQTDYKLKESYYLKVTNQLNN